MARQRFIWPSFWTDPVTGRLSSDEALFFIGCFSNADDEGRLLGDPAYLGSVLFPYRGLSPSKVKALRDSVASKVPAFTVYEVDRTPYIAFDKWSEYQKPKYPSPSKIPPPKRRKRSTTKEKSSGNVPGTLGEDSGNDEGSLGERLPHGLGLGLGLGLGRENHRPTETVKLDTLRDATADAADIDRLSKAAYSALTRLHASRGEPS